MEEVIGLLKSKAVASVACASAMRATISGVMSFGTGSSMALYDFSASVVKPAVPPFRLRILPAGPKRRVRRSSRVSLFFAACFIFSLNGSSAPSFGFGAFFVQACLVSFSLDAVSSAFFVIEHGTVGFVLCERIGILRGIGGLTLDQSLGSLDDIVEPSSKMLVLEVTAPSYPG